MSYDKRDEDIELGQMMDGVLNTRDVEGARYVAKMLKSMNDDEGAEKFLTMANKWEREDNYHDEVNNN